MKRNLNQKSITFVVPAIAREGITKLVATQVEILKESGFVVYLIVLSDLNKELAKEYKININDINILCLHQPDTYLSIRNLISSPSTVIPILNFIKANKINTAIAHGPYAHYIIRLVKAAAFTRVKLSLIQYFHINQYEQFPLHSFPRVTINTINQLLAKLCDAVHVSVSEAVKEDVQKHLIKHKKHLVVYNPLPLRTGKIEGAGVVAKSLQLFEKVVGAAPSAYSLLLSNRIEHSKGQLFFMEVLERFICSCRLQPHEIKIFIAGDGVQREELLNLIVQKKLTEYVHYLGLLSTPELAVVLKQADLVVVPSMFEGFSFTTLEALEAGRLVLVSDAGGLKEVVQHSKTGFIFEAGNAEDCFSKLSYLYQNRNEKLINKEDIAADLRNRFSFQSHKERLLQVLKLV